MKRTAILMDGAFVLFRLHHLLGGKHATADDVLKFSLKCLSQDEELFRIYYYDCPPHDKESRNPVSGNCVDFKQTPTYHRKTQLQKELKLKDHVAYREGSLSVVGWRLTRAAYTDLLKNPRPITESDLEPNIKQKTIDMKIGLDISWLASKQIVDRIILVTADADFVPAMKFARREGIQIVLVTMGHRYFKSSLREHADEFREIEFP